MAGKGAAPGERRGGRAKGTPNKATTERNRKIIEGGITPLDYMLKVMRTARNPEMRFKAASAAAPYVHAKLANIELGNKAGEAFRVIMDSGDGSLL